MSRETCRSQHFGGVRQQEAPRAAPAPRCQPSEAGEDKERQPSASNPIPPAGNHAGCSVCSGISDLRKPVASLSESVRETVRCGRKTTFFLQMSVQRLRWWREPLLGSNRREDWGLTWGGSWGSGNLSQAQSSQQLESDIFLETCAMSYSVALRNSLDLHPAGQNSCPQHLRSHLVISLYLDCCQDAFLSTLPSFSF
jgi:hypothetical protein